MSEANVETVRSSSTPKGSKIKTMRMPNDLLELIDGVCASTGMTFTDVVVTILRSSSTELAQLKDDRLDKAEADQMIDKITEVLSEQNKVINEMRRVGNNVNQIARRVNGGEDFEPDDTYTIAMAVYTVRQSASKVQKMCDDLYTSYYKLLRQRKRKER